MFIYYITNTINNKKYVGQTKYSIEKRWKNHKMCANSKSCQKTKKDGFSPCVVSQCCNNKVSQHKKHLFSFNPPGPFRNLPVLASQAVPPTPR